MNHHALISVGIFAAAYLLIATEKINKTVVAVVGASIMMALRLVSFEVAIEAVDFNVIFLLVGMMTTVSILSKTGSRSRLMFARESTKPYPDWRLWTKEIW